jgi:NADPH-dependent glutamate synthase beta subunit-like oxidoreductase
MFVKYGLTEKYIRTQKRQFGKWENISYSLGWKTARKRKTSVCAHVCVWERVCSGSCSSEISCNKLTIWKLAQ